MDAKTHDKNKLPSRHVTEGAASARRIGPITTRWG
jgi:hypothetical protein